MIILDPDYDFSWSKYLVMNEDFSSSMPDDAPEWAKKACAEYEEMRTRIVTVE